MQGEWDFEPATQTFVVLQPNFTVCLLRFAKWYAVVMQGLETYINWYWINKVECFNYRVMDTRWFM